MCIKGKEMGRQTSRRNNGKATKTRNRDIKLKQRKNRNRTNNANDKIAKPKLKEMKLVYCED
jgi:hypothetical protein